jgi:UDP-N-acetylmuramoyl-L-alanyl-D-glutamate--2,6-diaminopimelate ligase
VSGRRHGSHSHALTQGRVTGIDFDVALFTNLTQDHLDYHKTMEQYATAKKQLFLSRPRVAILNADSPWCPYMQQDLPNSTKCLTFGINEKADLSAHAITLTPQGTHSTVRYQGEESPLFIPLPGRFNLYNLLGALAVCLVREIPLRAACEAIREVQPIPGRLEPVPNSLRKWVYVDYGHTDDALKQTLSCLRELTTGRIIHLFGCGGDRDRDKRPKMAAVSEQLADYSIVTNDNPRSEQGIDIAEAIVSGFSPNARYHIELDRKQAIAQALQIAQEGDVILLSGKGHETRQYFAHHAIEFDDRQMARAVCEQMACEETVRT